MVEVCSGFACGTCRNRTSPKWAGGAPRPTKAELEAALEERAEAGTGAPGVEVGVAVGPPPPPPDLKEGAVARAWEISHPTSPGTHIFLSRAWPPAERALRPPPSAPAPAPAPGRMSSSAGAGSADSQRKWLWLGALLAISVGPVYCLCAYALRDPLCGNILVSMSICALAVALCGRAPSRAVMSLQLFSGAATDPPHPFAPALAGGPGSN